MTMKFILNFVLYENKKILQSHGLN